MIADFAETYKIYNYRQLPATYVAILAKELNPNSRIKRRLAGLEVSDDYLLQTLIFDRLNLLLWIQTEDGSKGKDRPVSLYEKLTAQANRGQEEGFDSSEDFEKKRLELLSSIKKGGKGID